MQNLTITRTNGNIVRALSGEDHISGLAFYSNLTDAELPSGFSSTERIQAVSSIETAEKLGITTDSEKWDIKVLHYTLESIFNMNPGVSLYVGIFRSSDSPVFSEIKQLQSYASGRIRQVGVWNGHKELSETILNQLQSIRATLESQNKPLSILYAPKVADVTKLPAEITKTGRNGVSVLIGQDGAGEASELYSSKENTDSASVSALGDFLGAVSKAKVHQSVAWIEEFPTNVALAAFGDGTLYRDLDTAVVEALDTSRYIFLRTYDGLSGAYFNDNHTLDEATSDYAYISDVRTMDKAVRGVRTYLLPKLGKPMKVDASTGQLDRTVVENLITVGNQALEEMEKAGELSGYKFDIDADQDILSTSRVKGVIKNVAIGVMRNLELEIGFATSV